MPGLACTCAKRSSPWCFFAGLITTSWTEPKMIVIVFPPDTRMKNWWSQNFFQHRGRRSCFEKYVYDEQKKEEFILQLSPSTHNIYGVHITRGGTKSAVTWTEPLTSLQSPLPPRELPWPPSYKREKPRQNERVSILEACKKKLKGTERREERVSRWLWGFTFCLMWKHLSCVTSRCLRLQQTVRPSHKSYLQKLTYCGVKYL